MENVITMDYPVFGMDMNLEGIDMIRQYIDAIWDEQCYLMKFPREYVISELRSFHPFYEKEYFNIKEIVRIQMEKEKSVCPSSMKMGLPQLITMRLQSIMPRKRVS